jgi:SAM-dependent methyltransferase
LLRGLASAGIFQEVDGKRFALTSAAELLRSDVPGSMRALARMYGGEQYQAWGQALYSVQTGQPAFNHLYGSSYFDYFARTPDAAAIFDEAMTSWATQVGRAVVAAYDVSSAKVVIDVGGGEGQLLAAILHANPATRGILFDLPHVIARAGAMLKGTAVGERSEAVAGVFFHAVSDGGDLYLLAQILHDWDDDQGRVILENCRRAMRPGGKVLIVELVIPPGNEPFFGKWLDLHMLVLVTGRERTLAEYRDLLASAGFGLTNVIATASGASIVEATSK